MKKVYACLAVEALLGATYVLMLRKYSVEFGRTAVMVQLAMCGMAMLVAAIGMGLSKSREELCFSAKGQRLGFFGLSALWMVVCFGGDLLLGAAFAQGASAGEGGVIGRCVISVGLLILGIYFFKDRLNHGEFITVAVSLLIVILGFLLDPAEAKAAGEAGNGVVSWKLLIGCAALCSVVKTTCGRGIPFLVNKREVMLSQGLLLLVGGCVLCTVMSENRSLPGEFWFWAFALSLLSPVTVWARYKVDESPLPSTVHDTLVFAVCMTIYLASDLIFGQGTASWLMNVVFVVSILMASSLSIWLRVRESAETTS